MLSASVRVSGLVWRGDDAGQEDRSSGAAAAKRAAAAHRHLEAGRRVPAPEPPQPYRSWQITRPWPPERLWTPLQANRSLAAKDRSTHPLMRATRSARACSVSSMRSITGFHAIQTPALCQQQRHRHGHQGHADTNYGDCLGTHGRTILDWRRAVKPVCPRPAAPGAAFPAATQARGLGSNACYRSRCPVSRWSMTVERRQRVGGSDACGAGQ